MLSKLILPDWHKIRQWLAPRIQAGQIKLISLDVFDTVLSRCIEPPESIQRAVCRIVAQRFDLDESVVWQTRQQVERSLREQALAAGNDHECRYSDLMARWVDALSGTLDWVAFIQETEYALEEDVLHIKPDAHVFLDWAREQGVPLVATSDMYFDGAILRNMLAQKGILPYFQAVYVSADTLLAKHSGRLFQHVIADCGVLPEQLVHIGDNPVSDRRMACRVGVQGIWLYEKADLQRREQLALANQMAQRGGIWQGRHFFGMVQARIQQRDVLNPRNFYYRYGRDVLGAAFSVFMLGLQERLQAQPVDKVLFLARDGFIFQQMYQVTHPHAATEYVYVSRKVIAAAAVAEGLTHEQAVVAFYNPKQQGLASLCKVYGLPETPLMTLAVKHGFEVFDAPIQDWNDARLLRFLADAEVQTIVKQVGQDHKRLLEVYLRQVGVFDAKRVALVDIGWNGTVQKFLKTAFGERADYPIVDGYYFAFVPKLYADFGENNHCEGIVHDARRGNACERIPAEFEEVFEQGARAAEATTVGYEWAGETVVPVLKADSVADRQAELRCNASVARMQEGILDHWGHFLAIQRVTGCDSAVLLPYVHGLLERAVVYPTAEEVRELTRLVHTEDFGHDHVLTLAHAPVKWRDVMAPRHLVRRFEASAWRYALLEKIPTGLANFVCRVAYLHFVKK